jgi:hypothetical protein
MKNVAAVRDATLVAGLTAIAVTAFTTYGAELGEATWIPAPNVVEITTPIVQVETLSPGEEIITESVPLLSPERAMPLEAAALPATGSQPRIVIERRRLTQDERIRADIVDLLAQAPDLSGRIGVETRGAVVVLSGYTTTAGQAHRVARYASRVQGVRSVQNEIRPRVGGST